jgi:hypothetical protein
MSGKESKASCTLESGHYEVIRAVCCYTVLMFLTSNVDYRRQEAFVFHFP